MSLPECLLTLLGLICHEADAKLRLSLPVKRERNKTTALPLLPLSNGAGPVPSGPLHTCSPQHGPLLMTGAPASRAAPRALRPGAGPADALSRRGF